MIAMTSCRNDLDCTSEFSERFFVTFLTYSENQNPNAPDFSPIWNANVTPLVVPVDSIYIQNYEDAVFYNTAGENRLSTYRLPVVAATEGEEEVRATYIFEFSEDSEKIQGKVSMLTSYRQTPHFISEACGVELIVDSLKVIESGFNPQHIKVVETKLTNKNDRNIEILLP